MNMHMKAVNRNETFNKTSQNTFNKTFVNGKGDKKEKEHRTVFLSMIKVLQI